MDMMDVALGDAGDEDRLVRSMTAYQSGEIDGFMDLYAELAADLERFFTAHCEPATAEDLTQETFLEIHRSRRSYRSPRPVRPWVFGLARNVLRRHRRVSWRRHRRETAMAARGVQVAATDPAPVAGDVHEALRRLPATGREVWMLRHEQGWSFREIAARLSIGVAAARQRASRAMRELRSAQASEARPNPPTDSDGKNEDGNG
jgi:RNA polymerase sigma-70 factor, ECF subfamily